MYTDAYPQLRRKSRVCNTGVPFELFLGASPSFLHVPWGGTYLALNTGEPIVNHSVTAQQTHTEVNGARNIHKLYHNCFAQYFSSFEAGIAKY